MSATNLCDYLDASSRAFGDRVAVVDPSEGHLTYRELDEQSSRIAGFLASAGVVPGDRVGIIAPKSAAVVASIFGVMKAGAAYVPADYTAPASRNRTILTNSAVKAVMLDPVCAEIMREWPSEERPAVVWLPGKVTPDAESEGTLWTHLVTHPAIPQNRLVDHDGLAYILYTSGSTGVPKGVTLTHRNATSFVDWCSATFTPTEEDRFGSHAPFHFDLSILDLYVSLKHGASLHLVSEQVGKSPQELASFIAQRRLTVWYSTPSILSLLAQFGNLDRHDCRSLRLALFAGEVFPVKHLREIVHQWPHAAFYNLYGPTETNVCTFARIPGSIPADRNEPYPIGHLCSHCEGLVLDAQGGREVTKGEDGLLYISGPAVFAGYWGRSDTGFFEERRGRRWYNTGDVVRETRDAGYVYIGRRDRMVKRKGYRIELGEIEKALYDNERVREAAVVALADSASGVRIVAFVAPEPGEHPSIIELKMFCGRALPAYMNPDAFIVIDALPRTSTNKVDYQGLVQMHEVAR